MPFRTREQKAEYDRRRYQEKRDELLGQKTAYYWANRDRLIAAVKARTDPEAKRQYDQANNARPEVKAKRAAQRETWRRRNPAKATAHDRARSFARRGARPDAMGRAYVGVLLGDPCCYCGGDAGQIDHIDPLALGGDSGWANLTSACPPCNYAKRDKPLLLALHGSY